MSTSPSYCAYCGKSLAANAAFCEYCGQPVKPYPAAAPARISHEPPRTASIKKTLAILLPVIAVICLGGIILLVVLGIVYRTLTTSQQATPTKAVLQAISTSARSTAIPTMVIPTLPEFEEPTPTADLGALAASFVSIEFDPSTCRQDSIGSYNFRGTVTNTSDELSLANIVLGGKLIDASENIVQWGIGSPEAVVLRPGRTVDFWFWIDWYKLDGFRCEVYLRSAEIADQ